MLSCKLQAHDAFVVAQGKKVKFVIYDGILAIELEPGCPGQQTPGSEMNVKIKRPLVTVPLDNFASCDGYDTSGYIHPVQVERAALHF